MERPKLTISTDEINSPEVDDRIRIQEERARVDPLRNYHPVDPIPVRTSLLYHAAVYMAFFGLLGGILGWGCGQILYQPNVKAAALDLMKAERNFKQAVTDGLMRKDRADLAINSIRNSGQSNPYFVAMDDPNLTETQRQEQLDKIDQEYAWKNFLANLLFYAVAGMLIATALSIAEPIVDRNTRASVINGSFGAILGLAGGVIVSLFVDHFRDWVVNSLQSSSIDQVSLANAATWGVLGLFLAIGPGIVLRSTRKTIIGALGGLLGGILGGLLFGPVAAYAGTTDNPNESMGRLVAIATIGLIAGLCTGLIENAAKNGWLKVTKGLIAGKQFVIYRNPTYIGSSLQCNIYLFRDPSVGPRHAAVHIVKGGFELENLPLGTPTLVNGRPIDRVRLKTGDEIEIGATLLMFHEKSAKKSQG